MIDKIKYIVLTIILILPMIIGCSRAGALRNIEIYYTVDATKPETGELYIDMRINNLDSGSWTLLQYVSQDVIEISEVKATNSDGEELPVKDTQTIYRTKRTIHNPNKQDIIISYTAKPGGKVKHGSQGYISDKYGLFTGDVLLTFYSQLSKEKNQYSGSSDIPKVRVKVKTKEGWEAVSSLIETKEGFDPKVNGKWQFLNLKYANFGIGQFDLYEKQFGNTNHRLYVMSEWPKEMKDRIAKNTFGIYNVFHEQAPFDDLPIYTTIFTPGTDRKKRVFGSIWANTQAYSYTPYQSGGFERTPRRVWELYAHRISHAINRYEINGFHTPDKYERWLDEGWASWVEITHTMKAGAVEKQTRFFELWRWYSRVYHGLDNRNDDVPVYKEIETRDHNIIRYLHYFKCPLVANQLDYEMKRHSGGEKSLNGFIKYIYPKYKNHQKPVPLLEELNNYMEDTRMDYFFDEYIKKTGFVYPLFDSYINKYRDFNVKGKYADTAIKVNDIEISVHQLNMLKRQLRQMDIKDEEEVNQKAIEMTLVMDKYKESGMDDIPEEMIELHEKLPGDVQLIIFDHQKDLLFDSEGDYKSWIKKEKEQADIQIESIK